MNRRKFLSLGTIAGAAAVGGCFTTPDVRGPAAVQGRPRKALMKLGCQRFGGRTDDILQFYARYGVQHIAANPDRWTAESIKELFARAAAYGITVHAAHFSMGNIVTARGAERDKLVSQACDGIRIASDGGYEILLYGISVPCGVPSRTEPTPGRGNISYSTFQLAKVPPGPDIKEPMSEQAAWDAVADFLGRVLPVAEKGRVKLACHPQDPPLPPGYRGAPQLLTSVEGLKRFVSLAESDCHGLHFCQGSICEMVENPARDICDIIRWFGERKRIFNVHFRNLRGRRDDFYETFPDEGDVNMLDALRAYRDVGYDGMIMPDHVPGHPDDPTQREAFAFTYGYIRGLIQAVSAEAEA